MESYNLYLYHERTARGLKMRAFAEKLKISTFKYRLIENGYIKPDKELVGRISSLLKTDYEPYTLNENSYPGEKPEKKSRFAKLYDFIGTRGFRIATAVLFVIFLGIFIASVFNYRSINSDNRRFYSDEFLEFNDTLIEKGATGLSVTGSWVRPEIYSAEKDKFTAVIGEYNSHMLGNIDYRTVYWTDDYRCTITVSSVTEGEASYEIRIVDLATNKESVCRYLPKIGLISAADVSKYKKAVEDYVGVFFDDYDKLISSELSIDVPAKRLMADMYEAQVAYGKAVVVPSLGYVAGIVFGLLSLFALIFSFVYGTKKGVGRDFRNKLVLYETGSSKPATDIRMFPFIPESVLHFLGIALLAVANLRFTIYLTLAFAPEGAGLSLDDIKGKYDLLMLLFYAAMFLHYFIDFDLYTDDKRVIRNIFAFGFVFLGLYGLELGLIRIMNPDSLLFRLVENKLPSVFGTITMDCLIMFLLFFTPKFINTKKKLTVFRSLSVIPVIIIIVTYIVFNGANGPFGWDLPDWFFYLFASQRISFSMLCVFYLFSLFFLRMHYRKKFGDAVAANYFNGNRFLFLKNLLVCAIIVVISVVDLLVSRSASGKVWGFGHAYYTLFLIPLLLFYHPHNGPRNKAVDYITLIVYILTLTGIVSVFFLSDAGIVI